MTQTRKTVKDDMLNTLIDPNYLIVKSGANVISYIALIEVSRN